ncbi:hypothetical protein GCM10007901_25750 [Dyella acidisoli]|uniref:Antitoxin Xre/MbcA/ParS-like toxin-binding domain-containing protein n=2 Tax=Dyella acidisoli TaxID=1867834 RepID=A0ABQ5XQX3_9GAMM|nr:hypothetical protein GCM10007901_25750 [Dyella acidisoli]
MRNTDAFKNMSAQLEEIQSMREQIAFAAFSMLEERLSDFSNMLIMGLGDRTRAVWWMCMRHRNLDGRNAYQVIADGEVDRLWEVVESLCGAPEL